MRRGPGRPYQLKGRGYIRVGTTTRASTFAENQDLAERNESYDPLHGTLPPREEIAIDFIGRKNLLNELWNWLKDPNSRRIALIGQGGSGKSAVAYQFASEIKDVAPEPFKMIIWMSAKSRRLHDRQIEEIRPDFRNLQTALAKLLKDTGHDDVLEWTVAEQKAWLLEVLTESPAVIVVDDYDTLLRNAQDPDISNCVEFFTELTFNTQSKLVMTSRVDPRTGHLHRVAGFPAKSNEGLAFVNSRLKLLGMKEDLLNRGEKETVIDSTHGIPLFIEDLLRLYRVNGDLNQTVAVWRNRGGQNAREFALKVEFDSLDETSKYVLLACSLLEAPPSFDDVRVITEFGNEDIAQAILELQGLFLVSSPQRNGEETSNFHVSENTANLVKQELRHTSQFIRIQNAIKGLSGEIYLSSVTSQKVGAAIRKALYLVRAERFEEAENVIRQSLDNVGLSGHPDLHGILGWIYKRWAPLPKIEQARSQFRRAAELKSRKPDMYIHWSDMELFEQNWSDAVSAASQALELQNLSAFEQLKLGNNLAFATSREGVGLLKMNQRLRAIQSFLEADKCFRTYTLDPIDVPQGAWAIHSRMHNSLVINNEHLYEVTGESEWFDSMVRDLEKWEAEHPDDPKCNSESLRIRDTYRLLL